MYLIQTLAVSRTRKMTPGVPLFIDYHNTSHSHRGPQYLRPRQLDTGETTEPFEMLAQGDLVRRSLLGGALAMQGSIVHLESSLRTSDWWG